MLYSAILMAAFSLVGATVYAQSNDQKDVEIAVESLRKAMLEADQSALEKLTSDQLSYGHSSGLIENKKTFIESLVSGKFDFVSIAFTDQSITIADHVALVRHVLKGESNDRGKEPGKINIGVLLVWQKQKKDWKLIARQAFKL